MFVFVIVFIVRTLIFIVLVSVNFRIKYSHVVIKIFKIKNLAFITNGR